MLLVTPEQPGEGLDTGREGIAQQVERNTPPEAERGQPSAGARGGMAIAEELDHRVPEFVAEFARVDAQERPIDPLAERSWPGAQIFRHVPEPAMGRAAAPLRRAARAIGAEPLQPRRPSGRTS